MLISDETQEKLNLLIQRFFQHNRFYVLQQEYDDLTDDDKEDNDD